MGLNINDVLVWASSGALHLAAGLLLGNKFGSYLESAIAKALGYLRRS